MGAEGEGCAGRLLGPYDSPERWSIKYVYSDDVEGDVRIGVKCAIEIGIFSSIESIVWIYIMSTLPYITFKEYLKYKRQK